MVIMMMMITNNTVPLQSFSQYMAEHPGLRAMIETGKGNLQWERDIPAQALANLQRLATEDFRWTSFMCPVHLMRGCLCVCSGGT